MNVFDQIREEFSTHRLQPHGKYENANKIIYSTLLLRLVISMSDAKDKHLERFELEALISELTPSSAKFFVPALDAIYSVHQDICADEIEQYLTFLKLTVIYDTVVKEKEKENEYV